MASYKHLVNNAMPQKRINIFNFDKISTKIKQKYNN